MSINREKAECRKRDRYANHFQPCLTPHSIDTFSMSRPVHQRVRNALACTCNDSNEGTARLPHLLGRLYRVL